MYSCDIELRNGDYRSFTNYKFNSIEEARVFVSRVPCKWRLIRKNNIERYEFYLSVLKNGMQPRFIVTIWRI